MNPRTPIEQEETENTENEELKDKDFRTRMSFPVFRPESEANRRPLLALMHSLRALCLLLLKS
jgi:hypothetical protein